MTNDETMTQVFNGHMIVVSSNYDGGTRTWGGFVDVGDESVIVVSGQRCPLHALGYLMQFTTD